MGSQDDHPDIYFYIDYRQYLDAWFKAHKKIRPTFSHRVFARLAGHSSPSFLNEVIQGRRNLTSRNIQGFSKAMKLDKHESDFLRALVELDQGETVQDRNRAWESVSATRRFREATTLEEDLFRCLSHWWIPAVHELAACSGFREDPAWIAQQLRPTITEEQASEALTVLRELEMLTTQPDGSIARSNPTVATPHQLAGLAAANYHLGVLERAREALDSYDASERRYGGMTVAVPESLLPRLHDELIRFQEHLLNLCDGDETPRERVYQVALQLFPLSVATEDS